MRSQKKTHWDHFYTLSGSLKVDLHDREDSVSGPLC